MRVPNVPRGRHRCGTEGKSWKGSQLGEISEDYDSAMIAAYLAQREAMLALLQSAPEIPALDEQSDPGSYLAEITFKPPGELDRRRPRGIPART